MLVDNNGAKKTLPDLLAVMAALRTPGTGCPWDLEQTFATIAPYTIEEAYEVADESRTMISPDSRTSWAIFCSRLSITPAWRKSKTRSHLTTSWTP